MIFILGGYQLPPNYQPQIPNQPIPQQQQQQQPQYQIPTGAPQQPTPLYQPQPTHHQQQVKRFVENCFLIESDFFS